MKNTRPLISTMALMLFVAMLLGCEPKANKAEIHEPEGPQMPPNFTLVQNELIAFYNSGEYMKQFDAVAKEALDYLETVEVDAGKSVLVLDIDDTSVSNGEVLIKTKFCKNSEWLDWLLAAKAPALPSLHTLYERALAKGVEVVFLTARDDSLREVTIKNLNFADYGTYDTLIMKVKGQEYPSSAAFKTGVRKALIESGKDIVLNVGDQESDVSGGFAKKALKLPNPFYFTK